MPLGRVEEIISTTGTYHYSGGFSPLEHRAYQMDAMVMLLSGDMTWIDMPRLYGKSLIVMISAFAWALEYPNSRVRIATDRMYRAMDISTAVAVTNGQLKDKANMTSRWLLEFPHNGSQVSIGKLMGDSYDFTLLDEYAFWDASERGAAGHHYALGRLGRVGIVTTPSGIPVWDGATYLRYGPHG